MDKTITEHEPNYFVEDAEAYAACMSWLEDNRI